jgi:SAM-dependent methyltransferase
MDFSKAYIETEVAKRFWYHKINLGNGIITPGYDFDDVWNGIRKSRETIDYKGKRVLDIASWDGMWAFEAEKLGASFVVATDADNRNENFEFVRSVLNSSVRSYYNIPPHRLSDRLDAVIFSHSNPGLPSQPQQKEYLKLNEFDIVQHLGLLYHLRDPLLTISQARSVIKEDGYLLLETAVIIDDNQSCMYFNNNNMFGACGKLPIYDDISTWWAPTVPCLIEMVQSSLFEVNQHSIRIHKQTDHVGRASLVAKAVAPEKANPLLANELAKTYRHAGMQINIFRRYLKT